MDTKLPDPCAPNFWYERYKLVESECNEQARLLGMSGSREASLLAKVAQLELALKKIRAFPVGTLRTLEEECDIWRIADNALKDT